MDFIVEKDPRLIPQVLSKILDSCVNGVSLADPDQEDLPLVYVNKAFETITGGFGGIHEKILLTLRED